MSADLTITQELVNERLAELTNLDTLLRSMAGMSADEAASTNAYIRERLKAHRAELESLTGQNLLVRNPERPA